MKLTYLTSLLLLITALGCKKENFNDVSFINTQAAPGNLNVLFDITQDNTGLVTLTPNGEGVANFDVYFGDGTSTFTKVQPSASVQHKYAEGNYTVKLVAHNLNGKTTEITKALTVSFREPENVEVTAVIDAVNKFKVNVSAKALYETMFRVYFGDVANEVPKTFVEGETISHVYAATGTYNIRVVALSGGAASATVTKSITILNPVVLPLDFEATNLNYSFTNFDGGLSTVINNPQANGINTSARVGKMVKNAGQVWGGSMIPLGTPINFANNKFVRMKVFSPRVGAKVLFKVENATDGSVSFEKEVATTVANAWEDLVFDFSAINTSRSYQNIVLIFDLGTMGDGSANFTYLFDDIRVTNVLPTQPGSMQVKLPITFDDPLVNYTVIDFGNNVTSNTTDPINNANKVKKTIKAAGAETWAGTTMSTASGLAEPIPFSSTNTKMSVRVFSPAAGLPIRLKVEDRTAPAKSVETEAITTVANAWETLTFDFAKQVSGTPALNLSTTYNLASIFFDFGTPGSGKTFYWDDVQFVTGVASSVSLPLTFESTTLNYEFTDFNGGKVTIVPNPNAGGINTSSKVGKMVKGAGEVWGGSFITLGSPINFNAGKIVKMKVYAPRVGAKVLLKVEHPTDGSINFEKEVSTTKANAWEELTFDFSAINTNRSYQKIVLIFDLGTVGDGSANFTYLFDDITLN